MSTSQICHSTPGWTSSTITHPYSNLADIAMDFITGLPLSHGYSIIMVVIDRLSKFSYFIPILASHTTHMVAGVLVQNALKIHGIPHFLVSD